MNPSLIVFIVYSAASTTIFLPRKKIKQIDAMTLFESTAIPSSVISCHKYVLFFRI